MKNMKEKQSKNMQRKSRTPDKIPLSDVRPALYRLHGMMHSVILYSDRFQKDFLKCFYFSSSNQSANPSLIRLSRLIFRLSNGSLP